MDGVKVNAKKKNTRSVVVSKPRL